MTLHLLPSPPYPQALLVEVFTGSLVGMLLGLGAEEVWVVQGPKVGRIVGEGGLLFGEHEGLPPEGFHHGTSLEAARKLKLKHPRCVVLAPQLYRAIGNSSAVLLGHFRNAKFAVQQARQQGVESIAAVASAPQEPSLGSQEPSLGNILAAGFLAKRMQQLAGLTNHPDSRLMAMALLKSFPDPQEALFQSELGQQLFRMGRTEDIALASLISVDPVVPQLVETRLLEASHHGLSQDRYAYCFKAAP
jgi:2-phosphosulfolactate phosphatase